ncbi:Cell division control protein 11 [Sorochytrium milnesiophthora]
MADSALSPRRLPAAFSQAVRSIVDHFVPLCGQETRLAEHHLEQVAQRVQAATQVLFPTTPLSDHDKKRCNVVWELVWSRAVIDVKNGDRQSLLTRYTILLDIGLVWEELALSTQYGGTEPVFVSMLADILDISSIRICTAIFDYIHDRIARVARDVKPRTKKAYLSICTGLLRRATSTVHPKCVSNVLLFTSRVFPLDDKGLFNVRGSCNASLSTTIDDIAEPDGDAMESEEVEMDRFYKIVWQQQQMLEEPRQLLASERQKLTAFLANVSTVADRFVTISETLGEYIKQTRSGLRGPSSIMSNVTASLQQRFFSSKFLTSRQLFDEQVTDPYFRRQVLVQYLIVFEFLLFYTDSNMKAQEAVFEQDKQLKKNSNMLLGKGFALLSAAEVATIKSLRTKAVVVLSKIPPDGIAFVETLLYVLKQESTWMQWKLRFCSPEFVVPTDSLDKVEEILRVQAPEPMPQIAGEVSADDELSSRTLEQVLSSEATKPQPASLHTWTEDVEDEFAGVDEYTEWHKSNKPFWVWQAVRLWSERDYSVLGRPVTDNGLRDFYRRWRGMPEETEEEKQTRLAAKEAEMQRRRKLIEEKQAQEEAERKKKQAREEEERRKRVQEEEERQKALQRQREELEKSRREREETAKRLKAKLEADAAERKNAEQAAMAVDEPSQDTAALTDEATSETGEITEPPPKRASTPPLPPDLAPVLMPRPRTPSLPGSPAYSPVYTEAPPIEAPIAVPPRTPPLPDSLDFCDEDVLERPSTPAPAPDPAHRPSTPQLPPSDEPEPPRLHVDSASAAEHDGSDGTSVHGAAPVADGSKNSSRLDGRIRMRETSLPPKAQPASPLPSAAAVGRRMSHHAIGEVKRPRTPPLPPIDGPAPSSSPPPPPPPAQPLPRPSSLPLPPAPPISSRPSLPPSSVPLHVAFPPPAPPPLHVLKAMAKSNSPIPPPPPLALPPAPPGPLPSAKGYHRSGGNRPPYQHHHASRSQQQYMPPNAYGPSSSMVDPTMQHQYDPSYSDPGYSDPAAQYVDPQYYVEHHDEGYGAYGGYQEYDAQAHYAEYDPGMQHYVPAKVVGREGVGKSTFLRTLTSSLALQGKVDMSSAMPTPINTETVIKVHAPIEVDIHGHKVAMTLIDTPGLPYSAEQGNELSIVLGYIESQFETSLIEELKVKRNPRSLDTMVHVVLYLLPPILPFHPVDLAAIRALSNRANVIPLLAHADSITNRQLANLKTSLLQTLGESMKLFDFANPEAEEGKADGAEEADDEEEAKFLSEMQDLRNALPLTVIGAEFPLKTKASGGSSPSSSSSLTSDYLDVNGKKILGREYKWGVVNVDDESHCELGVVKYVIFEFGLVGLRAHTRDVLYERYRTERLIAHAGKSADAGAQDE